MIITSTPQKAQRPRGFAGLQDPFVGIGGANSPLLGTQTQTPTGAPCPDCPTDCQETDVQETWYLSPQQESPSDKAIPVTRTTKTCNDDALEIDCDNTGAVGVNGLGSLSNANDTALPDSTVFVADAAPPCSGSGIGVTGLILIVLGVATVTALATSALSTPRRRY